MAHRVRKYVVDHKLLPLEDKNIFLGLPRSLHYTFYCSVFIVASFDALCIIAA
jgi:hypothetical protein